MQVAYSFEDKLIIVVERNEPSRRLIDSTLKNHDYSKIYHVDSTKRLIDFVSSFNDKPNDIGLIIINEQLMNCPLRDVQQGISGSSDEVLIPFLIICDTYPSRSSGHFNKNAATNNNGLTYRIASPIDVQELLLAVIFLLKLGQERLAHYTEKQQLILETSQNRLADAKLKYLAAHDELTGLYNRSNFERQLKLALNLNKKWQKNTVLLFIEIDRFSLINEIKGFDIAERLLVELAKLIRQLAPPKSLFARVGVNELCVYLEDMSKAKAKVFAKTLKTSIETQWFVFDDTSLNITLSLGIVTADYVMPTDHPGKIIQYGRQACDIGKLNERDRIGIYNGEANAVKQRQSDIYWMPIIESALKTDALFLVFQPVVELNNGAISHYEVLLRLRLGDAVILPNEFIPSAERTGLIQVIDLWVIENTIAFLATLPSHRAYVSVAIKLSAHAHQSAEMVSLIRDKLELTWVGPDRLIFEITEIAVIENFEATLHMVNEIRALGCKFAMRNNGTGFNALEKIKNFPVEYIKIDGKFMKQVNNEENDQRLLKSIVDTINNFGKKTIFVYVESPSTVLKLREVGVALAQGYTLGKPECNLLEGPTIPFAHFLAEQKQAEKALSEKESYLRVLIDNIPFLVWLKDTNSRFLAVNQLLAEKLGLKNPEAIVGNTDFEYYPPEKAKQYQSDDREVLISGLRKTVEEQYIAPSGQNRWTEIFLAPVLDKSGEALGTLGFARDITERKSVEADLRIAATAFEAQEGIVVTDANTYILKINQAFTRITGFSANEAIGRKMNLLKSEVQDNSFYQEMWKSIRSDGSWQGEIWNRRKDGQIYPAWQSITAVKAEDETITHYVGTMIDITARKAMEEKMQYIAHHDVLTDLPNRMLLADRLHQALAQAKRMKTKLALMYIDLDKFKPVNDNFGHDVGDLLLKEVASRLMTCIKRESDTIARLGGDEFVVLLSNYENEGDIAILAEKMLNALSEPFCIQKNQINISSSIGIATYPDHGADAISLMKNADQAMYQAKHAGRSCVRFHQ